MEVRRPFLRGAAFSLPSPTPRQPKLHSAGCKQSQAQMRAETLRLTRAKLRGAQMQAEANTHTSRDTKTCVRSCVALDAIRVKLNASRDTKAYGKLHSARCKQSQTQCKQRQL